MSRFFTKYFPVEGEIREGDIVRYEGRELEFPDGFYSVLDSYKEGLSVYKDGSDLGIRYKKEGKFLENGRIITKSSYLKIGYNIFNKDLQKVKLFLCSRDITLGDKIYLEDGDGVLGSLICDILTPLILENGYKIIGEISPGALSYVKEGDEFAENCVHFEGWNYGILLIEEDTLEAFVTHGWIENHPDEYDTICTIKGPCGHFH